MLTGYTDRLVAHLMDEYACSPKGLAASLYEVVKYIPHHLSTTYHRPDQEEAVRQYTTRFAP